MHALLEELGSAAAAALVKEFGAEKALPPIVFEPSPRADVQCATAMRLGKSLGRAPLDVAALIADAVAAHPAVAKAEVAKPGFVNVTLHDAWLAAHLDDALVHRPVGAGQTVVLDYSSPNVAKPMHIGHIRSTILGEAMKRVLRAVGYAVVADNHLGDWGTQFGKLIVAWRRYLDRAAYERDPVGELLRIYVKFSDEEKAQKAALGVPVKSDDDDDDAPLPAQAPELLREARAELVKLQAGDPENVALWKQFIDVSMIEFERIYKRLGVSFDEVLGESFYNDRLPGTVDALLATGTAEPSQGAVVVNFTKERDGAAMTPMLVRKADGGFLYGTSDVAAMTYRMERWNPSRILIVTDERQQLHFRQLFAVARRLGIEAKLEHVWFGLMRLPEGTFSTRDGNVISLEALLDEAEERAAAVARSLNPELSDAEVANVARVVGIGSVKYNDLSKDRQTLVTFTWDKALSLQGNTAPYVQYAYARIRSIQRKVAELGAAPGPLVALEPAERALVLTLLKYPLAVEDVAMSARPHVLCDYLFALAGAFATFFNDCPVKDAEPAVRASRLTLCDRVATVLQRGLDLLGIEVVERM
jgi:arginyl-tRNA synthetase